jgi:hypothetical protein
MSPYIIWGLNLCWQTYASIFKLLPDFLTSARSLRVIFLIKHLLRIVTLWHFSRSLSKEHYGYVQHINPWPVLGNGRLKLAIFSVGVPDDWKNASRGRWRTGRIVKVYPGADGLVRAADVEFATGMLRRGKNQPTLLEASSLDPAADLAESTLGRMDMHLKVFSWKSSKFKFEFFLENNRNRLVKMNLTNQ